MQKRNLILSFIIALFLISLVSAAYGSYSSFSIADFLSNIDQTDMILVITFIISLAVLHFAAIRGFRGNKVTAGIVSGAGAFLITYGFYKWDFNIEGLFSNIGISSDLLSSILPILLLAGLIYLIYRFRSKTFWIVGLLAIGISFTDLIYEKGLLLLVGIVLVIIGLWIGRKKKLGMSGGYNYPTYTSSPPGRIKQFKNYWANKKKQNVQIREQAYQQKLDKRMQEKQRALQLKEHLRKQKEMDKARKQAYKENARKDAIAKEKAHAEAIKENAKRKTKQQTFEKGAGI